MQNAQVTKSRININLDRPWILDYLRQRLRKNITDPMNSWRFRVFLNSLEYRHTFEAHCRRCWKGFYFRRKSEHKALNWMSMSGILYSVNQNERTFPFYPKSARANFAACLHSSYMALDPQKNQRESLLTARLCRSKGQNNRCPLKSFR